MTDAPKKAAIMLDSYKLPVFERRLKAAGYEYSGPISAAPGTLMLTVIVPDGKAQALAQVILAANNEASNDGKR